MTAMKKEIIINSTPQETRVAILENGLLVEVFIESKRERGILGSVFKGKVLKVLPGMQAAFVDIGMAKAGFLYVADIQEFTENYEDYFLDNETPLEEAQQDILDRPPLRIEEMLREGQEIVVQVAKEPLGTKGARLTNRLALPGRYLVFLPGDDHIGVSRRIVEETERDRLRAMIQGLKPPQGGLIIRTVGEGSAEDEFRQDLDFLLKLWRRIKEKSDKCHAPHLIHADLDLVLKTIRDHFTAEVDRLLVDNAEDHQRILDFVQTFVPQHQVRIELYQQPEPIFDAFDLELEIGKLLDRKVWLKSGGYITIDPTEALVTIDVNTGKYVGREDFEETILKTNLEAAREIAYQLRLRNLGGIIIIDFIDMEKEKNRERVFKALEEALSGDRAAARILQISELGLVEMTRKRNRPPMEKTLCQPCPHCKGKGQIKSAQTVSGEIFRELVRAAHQTRVKNLLVEAHPSVADVLTEDERAYVEALEKDLQCGIIIKSNPSLHHEQYDVIPLELPPHD